MYKESYAACARVIISFHLSVQQRCHGVVSILSYNSHPDIAIEFLTTIVSILVVTSYPSTIFRGKVELTYSKQKIRRMKKNAKTNYISYK